MPSRMAPNRGKQFDARTAALVVNNSVMEDIESFGFDQSKDHELQYTIDQNAIWVKSTPELTGSFVLKETSPSIPIVDNLFLRDRPFDITVRLAETAAQPESEALGPADGETFEFPSDVDVGPQDFIQFSNVMITDFSKSDYEVDGMPTMTAEWQGVNRQDENAVTGEETLAAGQLSAAQASQN